MIIVFKKSFISTKSFRDEMVRCIEICFLGKEEMQLRSVFELLSLWRANYTPKFLNPGTTDILVQSFFFVGWGERVLFCIL